LELRLRHLDDLIARHYGDAPDAPLRSAAPISSSRPAQMTKGMFSVLKAARKVGSGIMNLGRRGYKLARTGRLPSTAKTAEPSTAHTEPVPPPPDPLALFKAQDLVQLFCLNGRNVQLEVNPPTGEPGVIIMWQGKVLHARRGAVMGNDAFYALVLLPNPKLHVTEISVEPPATITDNWEGLLMEAAVRKDTQDAAAALH
jgi:hypothetical protein